MSDNQGLPARGRAKSFHSRVAVPGSPTVATGQPTGIGSPSFLPVPSAQVQMERAPEIPAVRPVVPTQQSTLPTPPDFGIGEMSIAPPPSWDAKSEGSTTSRTSCGTRTTGAPVGFDETRKHGVKGQRIDVITNFVAMEDRSNHTIKQYRVDFFPVEDHTFLKKQLMSVHEGRLGKFIFDGAMLYVNHELAEEDLRLKCAFKGSAVHDVILRKVGEIKSDDPIDIQFYNTVFRKCLGIMNLDELGRHFFDRHKMIKVENAPLELWPGYITAIKQHDAGVLLCIEATHKVLRTTSVLDMIKEIIGKNRNLQAAQEEVRKEVVGQIVITHYNRKTYRVDAIDFGSTPVAKFSVKKDKDAESEEISYVEYYKSRYGIVIPEIERSQPLLVSLPRKKDINKGMRTNIYLVPSLCNLTGLSDNQRKDYKLMQKMSDHLHMDPITRKRKLQEFMDSMKSTPAVETEFKNWNVVFNPEFLRAKARALNAEEIHMRSKADVDTFLMPDGLADWTNLLKRNYMLDRKDLSQWLLYMHTDHKAKAPKLLQGMRDQAMALGMQMDDPMAIATYGGHMNSKINDKDLVQPLDQYKGKVKFVVFVLPNNQLGRYTQVKKFFVLNQGIPLQCLLERNIENKNFNSIMSKMMIQVNSKLGGVPWSVKVPFKTRVMILGYDVYHCAERKNESVGALVATISPNLGTYFSVVSFHKDKSELSNNMCLDTKKCLEAFKMANGEYPDRILLFRDGVGEGQIKFVIDHEVRMMEAGIIEVYSQANVPKPKFTFIIVTKKINNRFMTINPRGVCNPPPGTVLDEVMTIPGRYDFFLVSQSVRQGTVSPTSYNVIYDNSGLTADSIQQLTYKLCHLYFNWSGTVAVPAPCQFAHKLAYLTGVALCKEAPPTLHNRLWYL